MIACSRSFRFLLVACLGLSGLFGTPGLGRLVLCMGEDGHVAVERSVIAMDAAAATCSGAALMLREAEDAHCGKCYDVPFSHAGDGPILASRGLEPESHGPTGPIPASIVPILTAAGPRSWPASASGRNPDPAGIRSVVLRI